MMASHESDGERHLMNLGRKMLGRLCIGICPMIKDLVGARQGDQIGLSREDSIRSRRVEVCTRWFPTRS